MNNNELEQKIKTIINKNNYFDMVMAAKDFEVDYKKSDFYKTTKKPLSDVIKESKVYYFTNFTTILNGLQQMLNNLNFENVLQVINEFGDMYSTENAEVAQSVKDIRDLLDEIKN